MNVLKFGGSSVANPSRIKSVIDVIIPYIQREKIAVVFSAFGGVTDILISLSTWALEGKAEYKEQLQSLEQRHLEAVRELVSMQKQSPRAKGN